MGAWFEVGEPSCGKMCKGKVPKLPTTVGTYNVPLIKLQQKNVGHVKTRGASVILAVKLQILTAMMCVCTTVGHCNIKGLRWDLQKRLHIQWISVIRAPFGPDEIALTSNLPL